MRYNNHNSYFAKRLKSTVKQKRDAVTELVLPNGSEFIHTLIYFQ